MTSSDIDAADEVNRAETGWLIELKPSVSHQPTWYARVDEDSVCGWSTDHRKAIRFAREADAQAIIDDIGWTEAFPSEHQWG